MSSVLAGIAGVLPACVFHVSLMVDYPRIPGEPLPVYAVLKSVGNPALLTAYVVILVLMILSTLVGLLQGLNERIDCWYAGRSEVPIPPRTRATISTGVVLISRMLSGFGIAAHIAHGYGSLAWAYLVVFVLPLIIAGPVLVYRRAGATDSLLVKRDVAERQHEDRNREEPQQLPVVDERKSHRGNAKYRRDGRRRRHR